jgi:hypothetical protein
MRLRQAGSKPLFQANQTGHRTYNRLIVECETLYDRPISIKDSPASRRATASWRWWCVSFGLRPMTFAGATADQFSLELGEAA